MKTNQLDVREAIIRSLEKINRYPGGNKLFFEKLGKSRSMVSQWKNGKAIPSDEVQVRIMAAVTETVSECESEQRLLDVRKKEIIEKFQSLICI